MARRGPSLQDQVSTLKSELELSTFLNKGVLQTNSEYKLRIVELERENQVLRTAESRLADTEDQLDVAESRIRKLEDARRDAAAEITARLQNERQARREAERSRDAWKERYERLRAPVQDAAKRVLDQLAEHDKQPKVGSSSRPASSSSRPPSSTKRSSASHATAAAAATTPAPASESAPPSSPLDRRRSVSKKRRRARDSPEDDDDDYLPPPQDTNEEDVDDILDPSLDYGSPTPLRRSSPPPRRHRPPTPRITSSSSALKVIRSSKLARSSKDDLRLKVKSEPLSDADGSDTDPLAMHD